MAPSREVTKNSSRQGKELSGAEPGGVAVSGGRRNGKGQLRIPETDVEKLSGAARCTEETHFGSHTGVRETDVEI